MNDNHPEIRRLRLYYSDQIRPLEEKITSLKFEIMRLNHIIEDRESDELLCGFDKIADIAWGVSSKNHFSNNNIWIGFAHARNINVRGIK